MSLGYLLDTCVLSETSRRNPHPAVIRFIETAENLMLPIAVVMEFQMGITEISQKDPVRAVRLATWYQRLAASGLPVIDTNTEIAEVWGVLAADPRLKNLFVANARAQKPRAGQDLHIAAVALVHRVAIATMNVKDFTLIDRFYPLPGIYNPMEDRWHARMEPLSVPGLQLA
ncbi:type II toxin-antitoxin system VapC family toxin [Rhizobium daejeonense]|uniref:Type II toxin-antitoxin system VapC family toxin n=1 Tax=Rhizobium daejeonense TaxID=240521 RepID=A0A6M1RZQ2_9HYPH|nr:PIN domain-containing protein [Rhizobium daejeonense]NGO62477.1 type II toxin-antitoxin system VapC family toxin [Rhizobium daejeonense]